MPNACRFFYENFNVKFYFSNNFKGRFGVHYSMKNTLSALLVMVLASCASVNFNSQKLINQEKTYNSLFVLLTHSDDTFYEWDEDNYQYLFFGKFNDLDHDSDRKMLSNSLKRYLNSVNLTFANQHFPIHKPVPYSEFMEKIGELDFDGMLIVHTREKWVDEEYTDSGRVTRPNSGYHLFLLDKEDLEIAWLARTNVAGTAMHNFQEIYNSFSRELGKEMHQKGLIRRPYTY